MLLSPFRLLLLAVTATLMLPAPGRSEGTSAGGGKRSRTPIEGMPWLPESRQEHERVVYGSDDRIDYYQEADPMRLQLAKSSCGLIGAGSLTNNGNGTYTIGTSAYTAGGKPACSGEPFASQPTAMFCTGFLVDSNLIATAGHCYESTDLAATRFVFGFKMTGVSTAATVVSASQVYQGVAIVGRALVGELDYAVIRVDRPVTSPGAIPLALRRSGTVPLNTPVGVIGHPAGLPQKIAFGTATKVYENSANGYFTANLDTYGGNSGSPVFNQATGAVEGILVRGATDYVIGATCFTSAYLADNAAGEDVSKTLTFEQFVPRRLNKSLYKNGDAIVVRVVETNRGTTTASATLTTTLGDSETVTVSDPESDGVYTGSIPVMVSGVATAGNGAVEGAGSHMIQLTFLDSNTGDGTPATFTDTANIDEGAPVLSPVTVAGAGPGSLVVTFQSNEPTTTVITGGTSCSDSTQLGVSSTATAEQSITLPNLMGCQTYYLRIAATDEDGNVTVDNNGGSCHAAVPTGTDVSLSEPFEAVGAGWTHAAASGTDNWLLRSSPRANTPGNVYSYLPGPTTAADASLVSPAMVADAYLGFWHTRSFESGYDGGVLEISTNGGSSWTDLGPRIVQGGYSGTISGSSGNPLAGRSAWSGGSLGTMTQVMVDLTPYIGQSVRIRFRFGSDSSVASGGWEIDTVQMYSIDNCITQADGIWTQVQ